MATQAQKKITKEVNRRMEDRDKEFQKLNKHHNRLKWWFIYAVIYGIAVTFAHFGGAA